MAEALGHWILAWSVVIAAVTIWLRAARPPSSGVRYAGWLLATFAGLLLLPIVAVGPRISWREIAAAFRSGDRPQSDVPAPFRSWFDGLPASARLEPVKTPDQRREPRPGSGASSPVSSVADISPMASPVKPRSAPGGWLLAAFAVWGVGVAAFAIRLIRAARRLSAMRAELDRHVPDDLEADLQTIRRELGIGRKIRIAIHPDVMAPMCVGLFRPTIFWPRTENCPMSPGQRLASLTHELAHLRYRDDWTAFMAELWRALTWFYPPVHLALDRLSREREYRCDDLAASKLDTPNRYAAWLLDLAPVRVAPPLLSASLLGRSGLAERVRRIVRGESIRAKPLGRRRAILLIATACLTIGAAGSVRLVGFIGQARAADPADAPLPDLTPKQLAAKIRQAWELHDGGLLELEFEEMQDHSLRMPPQQDGAVKEKPITYPGRVRFAKDGRLWRLEYDAMKQASYRTQWLVPDRWSTGFDGTQLYEWDVHSNLVTLGDERHADWVWKPRELFWEQGGPLVGLLEDGESEKTPVTIRQQVVDGVRCYVADIGMPGGEWRNEYVVAPERGFLPIRRTQHYRGKLHVSQKLFGIREAAPGIWAPGRIEHESYDFTEHGDSHLWHKKTIRIKSYEPHKAFADGSFAFKIPIDVDVTDLRLGYSYHNDPWWPEVGRMLRDRFDWPEAPMWPLRNLTTHAKISPDSKPAPPIVSSHWINSKALDLASLRGRVVLVVFWDHRYKTLGIELIPALKQLHEHYKPTGLEMILVHSPTPDWKDLRRFAHEFGIESPIAIDAEGPREAKGTAHDGATAAAYGIQGRPCAFLIDHLGKHHPVGEPGYGGGRLVESLDSLLKQARVKNLPLPPSLDFEQSSRERMVAIDTTFDHIATKALAAEPKARISGRVVDGEARPIEGARIRATLQLTTLMSGQPGANLVSHLRNSPPRFKTASGPDGTFTIAELCKGSYMIKVEVPGKTWLERRVTIPASLDPASIEIIVKQDDGLSGRIVDEAGKPIAGAVLESKKRHPPDTWPGYMTTDGLPEKSITDDDGRFRYKGLKEGSFTIEVAAPGYELGTLKEIPAGTADIALTLKRADPGAKPDTSTSKTR
jgi:beta-lactamase regulating signal transducer with metallopeptidase domain